MAPPRHRMMVFVDAMIPSWAKPVNTCPVLWALIMVSLVVDMARATFSRAFATARVDSPARLAKRLVQKSVAAMARAFPTWRAQQSVTASLAGAV